MNRTELTGFYSQQHSMFGECPRCGEPFRLSEIKIWQGKPPNDWLLKPRKREQELDEKDASMDETVRTRIDTSVKTRIGQTLQHILPQFSAYRPDEMRWLGDPVDWVVFDGKQSGTIKEIVFMEGKSTERTLLSPIQREISQAVTENRVSFRTISLSEKLSELVKMN